MRWTIFLLCCYYCSLLSGQNIDPYQRPIQAEPSHPFDVLHYRIELDIDDKTRAVNGMVGIHLRSLSDQLKEIHFHAETYTVDLVSLSGKPLQYTQHEGTLKIELPGILQYNDSITLNIIYSTDSFFVDPTQYGMGQNYPLGIGFFEESDDHPALFNAYSFPTGARHWFPCYDHPNDRATHETIITTRADHKVLANGLLKNREVKENGRITYHWSQNQPHPTYLFNFVSGPYEVIEDKLQDLPINYWVYPNDRERGIRTFRRTPEVIEFFEAYFGIPYAWDKYDQIIVPGIGGGAEATTATLIGQSTLHDEKADKDFPSHWLVAHEAAHHWWGDLVSYADWTETWLSESFATYSEYLYSNQLYGPEEGVMNLLNKKETYLREAHTNYKRPISFNRWIYPNQNFDRHTYQKGALVLHMLRDLLGENLFRKVLNHFLLNHAYQPVRTSDFHRSIWEVTGQNMQWFLDQWILSPGHPELDIDYSWTPGQVILRVSQIQDTTRGVPIFQFPVDIEIIYEHKRIQKQIWIREKNETFSFEAPQEPDLILFDPHHVILKEWNFPKSKEELMMQVELGSIFDKIWALQELSEFRGEPLVKDFLIAQTKNGSFWATRKEALAALVQLEGFDTQHVLVDALLDIHQNVRLEAIKALGMHKNAIQHRTTFIQIFQDDDSYKVQAEALRALGKLRMETNRSIFTEALETESPRNMIMHAAEWALSQLK